MSGLCDPENNVATWLDVLKRAFTSITIWTLPILSVKMPAPNVKDTLRMQGKNANFFETDVKPLREPTRRLFEVYSGLAPDQVVPHILAVVRDDS